MPNKENLILTERQAKQKIKRLAFEIYERNYGEEKSIAFIGIEGTGYKFAQLLQNEFEVVSSEKAPLFKITVNKKAPLDSETTFDCSKEVLADKVVILVDDVLNTGKTLAYALKPMLDIHIKKMQVAVLVNRDLPNFPIAADFIGYGLSTTINQNVKVNIEDNKVEGVYLQ